MQAIQLPVRTTFFGSRRSGPPSEADEAARAQVTLNGRDVRFLTIDPRSGAIDRDVLEAQTGQTDSPTIASGANIDAQRGAAPLVHPSHTLHGNHETLRMAVADSDENYRTQGHFAVDQRVQTAIRNGESWYNATPIDDVKDSIRQDPTTQRYVGERIYTPARSTIVAARSHFMDEQYRSKWRRFQPERPLSYGMARNHPSRLVPLAERADHFPTYERGGNDSVRFVERRDRMLGLNTNPAGMPLTRFQEENFLDASAERQQDRKDASAEVAEMEALSERVVRQ